VKLAEESLQRACRVFEKQSKDIAGKIIDFIAQFEDELVRVWNKPKFVLNSHYIITLDKIIPSPPRASGGPG
jgi:adenine specific DNA methylase Mod